MVDTYGLRIHKKKRKSGHGNNGDSESSGGELPIGSSDEDSSDKESPSESSVGEIPIGSSDEDSSHNDGSESASEDSDESDENEKIKVSF